MKTSLKKLLVLFSFSILLTTSVIFACADWYMGYDSDSSFTPEVFADESYSPLFYSSQEPFYRVNYDTEHRSRFNNDITADWSAYLNGKISTEDVKYLLLDENANADIDLLFKAVQAKKGLPARFASLNIADDKVKSFINFLHFAKVIEACSMRSPYSWDYEESTTPPQVAQKTIDEITKLYSLAKDPFIKNRLWFQVMKGSFYSGNTKNVIDFFDKTKSSEPENVLYYRALSYVAGVHYSQKRYGMSNYLYSVVFDKCPELRIVATYNFHPIENSDYQESLALAKTPEEKAALWAILGFYLDPKQSIQEIYKLNPKSAHIDYLLTRFVNIKEVDLSEDQYTSLAQYRAAMKKLVTAEDLQFVTSIAKDNKIGNPFLWNTAAGYLSIYAGKNDDATQFFDKALKANASPSEMSNQQIRLLRLINTLTTINKLDSKIEGKLVADLTWLYNELSDDDDTFRKNNVRRWSKKYLSSIYKSQQNVVMAELLDRNDKFYITPSNVELMKTFFMKSGKTPWEEMVAKNYSLTLMDLYEYQGVVSAYNGELDKAITLLTAANGKAELLGNPFNGKIKDCHDCDHAAVQKTKYTKLTLVQKMKEMQDHVIKGEDVYNNSLLLANAYYNMSYFGNARVFYYGEIIDQGSNYIKKDFQSMLFSCSKAKEFYQKAFDAAANDEQKAKCVYMMAKCERNEFYAREYHGNDEFYGEPDVAFLAWDGFRKLKSNYAHTKYYKDVINECGYFGKYAGN
ncbi:hypothetical protein [Pseudochryseolinea flava]|nr:hypothetical protein [Pseudochryseolinea flava]